MKAASYTHLDVYKRQEVGGVRIVPKTPDKVRYAVRRMLSEVPERYAEWIERCPASAPESYKGLAGTCLLYTSKS